jgi:hypothetical protein
MGVLLPWWQMSGSQPEIVAQLNQELDNVLSTFFQAADDPACPFKAWTRTPQGVVMQPWC